MSLVPSVTELILAEFLYLQYEDEEKPIYLYVNSTGTTKVSFFCFCVDCIMLMVPFSPNCLKSPFLNCLSNTDCMIKLQEHLDLVNCQLDSHYY